MSYLQANFTYVMVNIFKKQSKQKKSKNVKLILGNVLKCQENNKKIYNLITT